MGTMVGDDGAGNQIGVAPGAKWIGCRNMNEGDGTPATYSECFQWFIAPTDLNNQFPNPTLAPHVINNSWGCPPSEGCTDPDVAADGRREHARGRDRGRRLRRQRRLRLQHRERPARHLRRRRSASAPPPTAPTTHLELQQPRPGDRRRQQPPEAEPLRARQRRPLERCPAPATAASAAPAWPGRTSRARWPSCCPPSPQLNGAVSADRDASSPPPRCPRTTTADLRRRPRHARSRTTPTARAASTSTTRSSRAAPTSSVTTPPWPIVILTGVPRTYTMTVTNAGPLAATAVTLDEPWPSSVTIGTVTPSQGTCTVTQQHHRLQPRHHRGRPPSATVTITITPTAAGSLSSRVTVSAAEFDLALGNNTRDSPPIVEACPPAHARDHGPALRAAQRGRAPGQRAHRARPQLHLDAHRGDDHRRPVHGARSPSPPGPPAPPCSSRSWTPWPAATRSRGAATCRCTSWTCRPRIPSTTS